MTVLLGILSFTALLVGTPLAAATQEPEPAQSRHLGLYSSTLTELARPSALTYDAEGNLWVADSSTKRIQKYDAEGKVVASVAWLGKGAASGLAIAENGDLWLCFPEDRHVMGLGPTGFPTGHLTMPNPDSPRRGFLDPRGLMHFDGRIWVVDAGWGRLDVFSSEGVWQKSIGEGLLKGPQDVCVDALGRLLVADTGHSRICAFDPSGELLDTFGEWGWFPGLFSDPSAIESHGQRIYVADRENQRIQVFDLKGAPVYRIGLHAILPREGQGTLHYPTHLALRGDGQQLALAEPMDGRVQIFGMGDGDAPPTRINRPTDRQPAPHYGLHWDIGAGYLAIPEPETHSIRIYDLRQVDKPKPDQQPGTPTLVTEIGGFGTELGRYTQPGGLHIGGSPLTLLVCDTGNGRLVETRLHLSQEDPLGFTLLAAQVQRAVDLASLNQTSEGFERPWIPRPVDVERAADGTVFVLCDLGLEVYVLDSDWNLSARFGSSQGNVWKHPVALGWNEITQELFVCDEGSARVYAYDRGGRHVSSLGKGILRRPFAISFDKQGNALIIDRELCALVIFDKGGKFVRKQGIPGIDRHSFFGPTDVDVDERGHIYVLDHGNHRGMVFDSLGAWFHAFGSRLYTKPARLPHTISMDEAKESE